MKALILSILSCCYFFAATAQTFSIDSLKNQMIKDWIRAKAYTQEYLDAMPADKYTFKATDSTRSFAGQMLHFSFTNFAFAIIATDKVENNFQQLKKWNDLEVAPEIQNKDSVTKYVNAGYDFMINALKKMDVSKFGEIVTQRTPGGIRTETRYVWLTKAFEHQTHHRGQCTIYFRLVGIKPPGEKLF